MRADYFLAPARTITAIKVDHSPIGEMPAVATMQWTDRDGRQRTLTFDGDQAREIITDLHASSMLGEYGHLAYLIGYLRSHNHQDGGGG